MKKKQVGSKKDMFYQKFYTKNSVVKMVLKNINFENYDFIIEPSAGAGAFSSFLPAKKSFSIDIAPESTGIHKGNYFNYKFENRYKNILVVGNPPFGVNNSLSKKFLNYSFNQKNVKTVAFILPNIYKKYSRQKFIPKEFKIIKIIDLPINSFILSGGEHHIPCSFFIFEKNSKEKDLRQIQKKETQDFKFVSKKSNYDFFIFGASPKKITQNPSPNNRGYYIKSIIPLNKLKSNFSKIKWVGHSGVNGGIYWLTATDIIENYERDIHGINQLY